MDDLRKTFTNITKNVAKTSGGLLKSTKLNISLANEEENLKSLYTEIGKKVHEIYAYGGSLGKFFDEKYKEIQTIEKTIDELKGQISLTRGSRQCSKCGKDVANSADFCPKCGASVGDSSTVGLIDGSDNNKTAVKENNNHVKASPQKHESTSIEALRNAGKTCPLCDSENEPDAKFCLNCGRTL